MPGVRDAGEGKGVPQEGEAEDARRPGRRGPQEAAPSKIGRIHRDRKFTSMIIYTISSCLISRQCISLIGSLIPLCDMEALEPFPQIGPLEAESEAAAF